MKDYRRCIACRRYDHRSAFLRIVRIHPCGRIQLNKGMGRSAYLCASEDCLRQAQRKNRLGRALKAAVGEAIYEMLRRELVKIGKPGTPPAAVSESSGGPVDDEREYAK